MRCVTQSQLYSGSEDRGSCVQACVASIFELPEEMAPSQSDVGSWTPLHYPGLQYVSWQCEPTTKPPVPLGHHGYWIASVHTQTEGFTDPCGRCWEFEGNENGPPICDPPRPCPFCGEPWGLPKGTRPGYHAIVMRNETIEHDPSPAADWYAERVQRQPTMRRRRRPCPVRSSTPAGGRVILQEPHRDLRTRCDFAKRNDVAYLVARLRAAMTWSAAHGRPAAGLAAPQIGVTLRIFVLNGYGAFVNPRVVKQSPERDVQSERCLSLPAELSVPVSRPKWVKVSFHDEHGAQKTLKLHGWDARAAQHELDHLDAILITDRRVAEAA